MRGGGGEGQGLWQVRRTTCYRGRRHERAGGIRRWARAQPASQRRDLGAGYARARRDAGSVRAYPIAAEERHSRNSSKVWSIVFGLGRVADNLAWPMADAARWAQVQARLRRFDTRPFWLALSLRPYAEAEPASQFKHLDPGSMGIDLEMRDVRGADYLYWASVAACTFRSSRRPAISALAVAGYVDPGAQRAHHGVLKDSRPRRLD